MAEYVIMPKLGFNMDKGKIVKWLKKEGEIVQEREPILQIETDKTVMDVEASIGGVLRKIFLLEESEVPVTLPIGIIAGENEDIEELILEAEKKLSALRDSSKKGNKEEKRDLKSSDEKKEKGNQTDKTKGQVKISPRAKKLANKLHIDLNQLIAYKGEGIINENDVEQFQNINKKDKIEQKSGKKIPYTGMRKIIGDRLSQSKFTSPHLYFTSSVNMQKSLEVLKKFNQSNQVKITINDLIVFVVARVLEKSEDINVSLLNDELIYHSQVNVGIAVAIEEGLIVPVVRDTNKKNIIELSKEIKKLAQLARQRKLPPEDYEGGTFTVSNLGMYDIDHFTAIINPPEAAILAVAAIKRCPIVDIIDGIEQIVIKPIMRMTLSVDHRLIDGVKAVTFLNQIKGNIENLESINT